MLEKMGDFFDKRLENYDQHMLTSIDSAKEFYYFTSDCLPKKSDAKVIDLGCGTGLELENYFLLNPTAKITGIDLAPGMLKALKAKFKNISLNLILGSYFEVPFGENLFDAAVSVESLHHFTKEEKIPLYKKLKNSLKNGGYFILTDYFAKSNEEEQSCREEFLRLKKEQGIHGKEIYHYDTPLTIEHEKEALIAGGFLEVFILKQWSASTATLKAKK